MEIKLSNIWPEWEIVAQISQGAYGRVYKAVRRQDDDVAAVKIISIPQNEDETEKKRWEYSDDTIKVMYQERAKDVLNEIDIMKKLRGANNVVDILDYKLVEKEKGIGYDIYIRMELLQPMAQHLSMLEVSAEPGKKFSMEAEAIKIGCDICRALESCHSVTTEQKKQIIHRDIKPDNILYHANGDIYKLGDFGISKELSKYTGDHTKSIGTRNYLAPEVDKGNYDCRVDIYSLGLVLYYLTNKKRLPFVKGFGQEGEAVMRRLMGEQLPPPECASPGLAAVIAKACAFRPEDRFATAKEFRLALESIGQQPAQTTPPAEVKKAEPAKVEPATPVGTFGPKKKKRKAGIWVVILVLVAIAAFWFGKKKFAKEPEAETGKPSVATIDTTGSTKSNQPQETEPTTAKTDENDGRTKESAVPLVFANAYQVKTGNVDQASGKWEYWYKLETASDAANYFISLCGTDGSYAVDCELYNGKSEKIASLWSRNEEKEIGLRLETNTTYWIKFYGDEKIATFRFSVEEAFLDAGTSREQALPIQLDTEYSCSIAVDKEVDWFSITTGSEQSVYRFEVNASINDNPVFGHTTMAVYDADGIKQKEITTDSYQTSRYFDLLLPTNATYTIKISAENSVPAVGDYSICVSQRVCDAGTDMDSATLLTLGERRTAKMDSTLADWYVFTAPEAGSYVFELHNINIGWDAEIVAQVGSASYFSGWANHEDSCTRTLPMEAGQRIYLEIAPSDLGDAKQANGDYILCVTKEEG